MSGLHPEVGGAEPSRATNLRQGYGSASYLHTSWRHQKRAQGTAEFLLEVSRLLQPDTVAVRAGRLAGGRVCRTDRALRAGLYVDGWSDEIHVSASVEVTVSK